MILVMPFGSTGSFTDKEWANGVGRNEGWETFVARDLVRAIDTRFRTIRARLGHAASAACPRAATARSTSPSTIRASSALVESWSGYKVRRQPRLDLRPPASAARANTPLDTLAAAAPALRAAAHLLLALHRHRRPDSSPRTTKFVSLLERAGIQHRFRLVHGGHNWALWRGNAADAYLAASKHLGAPMLRKLALAAG